MPSRHLLDASVLIALVVREHDHHDAAHRWFADAPEWGTTPITEAAFVRLVVNPVIAGQVVTTAEAVALLGRLCTTGDHRFLPDDSSLQDADIDLIGLVGHRQVTDFHLVNLAARAGWRLATFDGRLAAALAPEDRRHLTVIPI